MYTSHREFFQQAVTDAFLARLPEQNPRHHVDENTANKR